MGEGFHGGKHTRMSVKVSKQAWEAGYCFFGGLGQELVASAQFDRCLKHSARHGNIDFWPSSLGSRLIAVVLLSKTICCCRTSRTFCYNWLARHVAKISVDAVP